jgi:anti-sigma-K factor RskA
VKLFSDDLHTLTGVYALDAIDGPERERFEHHLTRCQSCGNEVRGLQDTATRLAIAVAAPAPEQMKERVLTAVARTRQDPPLPDPRPLPAPRPGWTRRLAIPLAAACVVVAIVLAVLLGVTRHQLTTQTAQQRAVAAVLNAPGARLVTARTSVGGVATVVVAASLHKLIFTSNGLPVLSDSRVYQLWVMGPHGSATSVGLLAKLSGGKTAPQLANGLAPGDQVGVTVEPAGGTIKPTTTPIVVIKLSA